MNRFKQDTKYEIFVSDYRTKIIKCADDKLDLLILSIHFLNKIFVFMIFCDQM